MFEKPLKFRIFKDYLKLSRKKNSCKAYYSLQHHEAIKNPLSLATSGFVILCETG